MACIFSSATAQRDSLRSYYKQSIAAYESKAYDNFLKYTRMANAVRPNHPALTYNLAIAYALNQQAGEAISALKYHLSMNAKKDYLQDEDFLTIKDQPDFIELESFVEERTRKIENSQIHKRLDQSQHHYESITSLPSGDLLLGTINTRNLLKVSDDQIIPVFNHAELYSVMGIHVTDQLIWVVSAALPEMQQYDETLKNTSTVFGLNDTFEVVFKYTISNALLGDVISFGEGKALATDGLHNKVYELSATSGNVMIDLSTETFNLQGLALHENVLYLADYITGVHQYDLRKGKLEQINDNQLFSSKGIDGLLYKSGSLIAFQNGTYPKRTLKLKTNDLEISSVEVIDQNLPYEGEPTQGVIKGDSIIYISNSAWDGYEDGAFQQQPNRKLYLRAFLME